MLTQLQSHSDAPKTTPPSYESSWRPSTGTSSDLTSIRDKLMRPAAHHAQPATISRTAASRKRGRRPDVSGYLYSAVNKQVPRGLKNGRTKLLKSGESDLVFPSHIGRPDSGLEQCFTNTAGLRCSQRPPKGIEWAASIGPLHVGNIECRHSCRQSPASAPQGCRRFGICWSGTGSGHGSLPTRD